MIMNASRCPLCGGENNCQQCSVGSYKGPCWCENVNIPDALLALVPPERRNAVCICRACVTAFHREQIGTVAKADLGIAPEIPQTRPADTGSLNGSGVSVEHRHSETAVFAALCRDAVTPRIMERDEVKGFSESKLGKHHSPQALAIRPGDFYFDHGLMVFAAAFHLRRGYCCGNGCRHCPYPVSP